jgi:stage II sporulation protein D
LSQWGAEGYALHGWSYRQILAHYYPATTLAGVAPRPVRVLVAQNRKRLEIDSASPFLLIDSRGRKVHVPARGVRFGPRLRLGKLELVSPVRIEPGAAVVTLNGAGYRGSLDLFRRNGRLDAVNVVSLEQYLRGVVPSEMPRGWSSQAYEAQAIGARSYALARLEPGANFDLYADSRDQVYGGIAAEQPATNQAIGATAGQVLTYGGRVIVAYYSASSGGRTEAVQDAWPNHTPEPYLVSVADPYDSLSPYHQWQKVVTPDRLSRRFHFPVVDLHVTLDGAGHASEVILAGEHGSKTLAAKTFARSLGLRSTRFAVQVLTLDEPPDGAVYGRPLALTGFLRGIGGVVLQKITQTGSWRQVAHVHPAPSGRFTVFVRPQASARYRLAVDRLGGPETQVEVAPRIALSAAGTVVSGTVHPAIPVRLELHVDGGWRIVAHVAVGPSGFFRTGVHRAGRYRVAAAASTRFLATASAAVDVEPTRP